MVPDNAINTSANTTTSPLFPNTAQADLGISSGRSVVDSQFSKSHGLPKIIGLKPRPSRTALILIVRCE